jgi:hypothetical protein
MHKIKVLILALSLLSGHLFAGPGYCVKKVYTSQIGVREQGNNRGPEVQSYQRVTGFDQPVPWCASFVAWVFKLCQVNTVQSAWSPAWFASNKVIDPDLTKPQPGDVFGIYFNSKGRIAHIGFVDEWPEGRYFITVEGNTNDAGSREGDGVYRKRRLKRQAHKISRWI